MIDFRSFSDIVTVYRKYGWILRRILTTSSVNGSLIDQLKAVSDAPIIDSDIDAAWFSRPPTEGPVVWEIRTLGGRPFALVESLDERDPDFEESLAKIEARLRDTESAKEAP